VRDELGITTDPASPFSDAYHQTEVEEFLRYTTPEAVVGVGNALYKVVDIKGAILQDYFNKFFVVNARTPVFMREGDTWMSITRMEVQSMWCPLQKAQGRVGTSGLGLGYFAIKAAKDPLVNSVDVWEIDPDVIELFNKVHVNLPPWIRARINIHNQSIYDMTCEKLDFFLADHYLEAGMEEMLSDVEIIKAKNKIKRYAIWTQERYLLELLLENQIRVTTLSPETRQLFRLWTESGLDRLRVAAIDEDFLQEFLSVYKKHLR
jgi:hypothetical protein